MQAQIVGVGIDVVDVKRFAASVAKAPSFKGRVFDQVESALPMHSLAARFAAKEALSKALGAPGGMFWLDCSVRNTPDGQPFFEVRGTVLARAKALGITRLHLSLSHDSGIASATVVAEGFPVGAQAAVTVIS